MIWELIRTSMSGGVLFIRLLSAEPMTPCTVDSVGELPYQNSVATVYSVNKRCMVTYVANDSFPDYLRGYVSDIDYYSNVNWERMGAVRITLWLNRVGYE